MDKVAWLNAKECVNSEHDLEIITKFRVLQQAQFINLKGEKSGGRGEGHRGEDNVSIL